MTPEITTKTIKIEEAFQMNRHQRRALAKQNGISKIPSIRNIPVIPKKDDK